jgi:type III pantothenate kinase
MAMQALDSGTSKLRAVEIVRTELALGRTTASSIQSGIYLGHLGALKEITARVVAEEFDGTRPVIIATGGFAALFGDTGLYDQLVPDLVLQGLKIAYELNSQSGQS